MARSPKSTGGGGFSFEDRVNANFLTYLLAGEPPLGAPLGLIDRLQLQRQGLGWTVDDSLLTLTGSDRPIRVAFSIKSNQQITSGGFPSDFVKSAWSQFLNVNGSDFDPDKDYLGLVTKPLSGLLRTHVNTLLNWATHQDAASLAALVQTRQVTDKTVQVLYDSVACPAELRSTDYDAEYETHRFLSRLLHRQYDFENRISDDESQAILRCQRILQSGQLSEAQKLWDSLNTLAEEHRPLAGSIDLPILLQKVSRKFKLRHHPRFESDWAKLKEVSLAAMQEVRDTIGPVRLVRQATVGEVLPNFLSERAGVLLGPSGSGKSVVARRCVDALPAESYVLWIEAQDVASAPPHTFAWAELNNSLPDIIRSVPRSNAFLIVDSIDRVATEEGFRRLGSFLRLFSSENPNGPWHVLLVCQQEQWNRIEMGLLDGGASRADYTFALPDLTIEELRPVLDTFPSLRQIAHQKHLWPVLLRPKTLDLFARHLASGGTLDTTGWSGETNLADWFWHFEVENKAGAAERSRFLRELAERQADALASETAIDDLGDAGVVGRLVDDHLCTVHQDHVRFEHDLLADWARLKMILIKRATAVDYLTPRATSPFWSRSIRLYGLYLLEQSGDVREWQAVFTALSDAAAESSPAQDLLLECILFAADPYPLLERLWPTLSEDGGKLLRRLLRRFLVTATVPDPRLTVYLAASDDRAWQVDLATTERFPYFPFWPPVLKLLINHPNAVESRARTELIKIAETWLKRGRPTWPLRKELASLVLSMCETELEHRAYGGRDEEHVRELLFAAAMSSFNEEPERVTALARTASGRIMPEARIHESVSTLGSGSDDAMPGEEPESDTDTNAWLFAPRNWPDKDYQDVCLNKNALEPLMQENGALAREIILALVVKPREQKRTTVFREYWLEERHWGIVDLPEQFPPMYWRGPFLIFLRHNPAEGIQLVVDLVNYATDRWAGEEVKRWGAVPQVQVVVDGESRLWRGDFRTYYWYRDEPPAPDLVVSALMALEKFLYSLIDEVLPLEPFIQQILKESRSVAFAGLLSAIGRKQRTLFASTLKILLGQPEFLEWERGYGLRIGGGHPMIGWEFGRHGQWATDLARDWNNLDHRKEGLDGVSLSMYLSDQVTRSYFADHVLPAWRDRRTAAADEDDVETSEALDRLLASYDLERWRVVNQGGGKFILQHTMPDEILERHRPEGEAAMARLRATIFTTKCSELLKGQRDGTQDDPQALWDDGHAILQALSHEQSSLASPDDVATGLATVLILLHREWLLSRSDKGPWCENQILGVIERWPKPDRFDSPQEILEGEWPGFVAQCLPALWAENPALPNLRLAVASLAMDHHHQVISLLMRGCFERKECLGASFYQLLNLLRRRLIEGHKAKMDRMHAEQFIPRPEEMMDEQPWSTEIGRDVRSFLDGTLSPALTSLDGHGHPVSIRSRRERDPWSYERTPYEFDYGLMAAAHAWIPRLRTVTNLQERREYLGYWQELLDCMTQTLRPERIDRGKQLRSFPNALDEFVLQSLGVIICDMTSDEGPDRLWRPIMAFGAQAPHFVASFLDYLFILNATEADDARALLPTWKAMIDFALASDEWAQAAGSVGYGGSLWGHLMGFHCSRGRWTAEKCGAVSEMRPYYARWAGIALQDPSCTAQFCGFLKSPAAEPILLVALEWIHSNTVRAAPSYWTSTDLKEELVELLARAWTQFRAQIAAAESTREAFTSLLARLSALQYDRALLLQKYIDEHRS